mgnify:CR=1 FL=1
MLEVEQGIEERKEELENILENLVSDSQYIFDEMKDLPKSNNGDTSCERLKASGYRIFYSENGFNLHYRDSEGELYEVSFFKKGF